LISPKETIVIEQNTTYKVNKPPLEPHHAVFLDQLNTLTQQHCYSLETNLPFKDLGTYEQIIQQYEFFLNKITDFVYST